MKNFCSLLLVIMVLAVAVIAAPPNPGSIWTRIGACDAAPQDANHYQVGWHVFVAGENFESGNYNWSIKGQPGGASCDPNIIVAGGTVMVEESGAFCIDAYVIAADDCGEYKVSVANKSDNYRVDKFLPPPPPPQPQCPIGYQPPMGDDGLWSEGETDQVCNTGPSPFKLDLVYYWIKEGTPIPFKEEGGVLQPGECFVASYPTKQEWLDNGPAIINLNQLNTESERYIFACMVRGRISSIEELSGEPCWKPEFQWARSFSELRQIHQEISVQATCIDPFVYKPTMRVHFEVTNPNSVAVEIPHGLDNALEPVAYQGTQPTLFAPGVTEWEIEIGRYEVLQWLLDGSVASASARTNICNYATQDDVYIAGVGVFYDTNKNGQYDAGEALLAPDFEGKIGEVYLLDQNGNTVDSRTLGTDLFFRAGRNVNFTFRQLWGEYYLVPQLSVPMPAGYRVYPNYRVVHTDEFPAPFYSLNNDFGLVPAGFVPDPLTNLDMPYVAALDWYLTHPVKPGVVKTASEEIRFAAEPQAFVLNQNYPNPFNPQTTIRYDLPEQALVTLTVYNVAGSIMAQLVNEQQEAGSYSRVWNAAGNPSGLYFYELRTASFHQIRRMLLVK